MKDITREQLSAFVDDELDDREAELLLRRLGSNSDLRDAALRFAVIGGVIRGEVVPANPAELPDRVSGQLGEAEGAAAATASAGRGLGLIRPVAGAAVAASVAVLAILSLSDRAPEGGGSEVVTVPEQPVSAVSPLAATPSPISRAGNPNQLRRFYLNHSRYAPMLGGQGTLIRMVRAPESEAGPADDGPADDGEDRRE